MTKDCTLSAAEKKLSKEITEDTTYPIMIPAISNITPLSIRKERNKIKARTATAPASAPRKTEKKPDRLKTPAARLLPPAITTRATPRLAPELIPRIEESARGLLNTVCSINPETERAAPQSKAATH